MLLKCHFLLVLYTPRASVLLHRLYRPGFVTAIHQCFNFGHKSPAVEWIFWAIFIVCTFIGLRPRRRLLPFMLIRLHSSSGYYVTGHSHSQPSHSKLIFHFNARTRNGKINQFRPGISSNHKFIMEIHKFTRLPERGPEVRPVSVSADERR